MKIEATRTDVKMLREPSDSHATVDSLKDENRMQDWLGRMQHYAPQVKRQVQAREAMETSKVIKHDRNGVRPPLELDSVEGSLTRKSKAAPLSVRQYNRAYTVQIGAFGKGMLHSALQLQKAAQEQFPSHVVLNQYYPFDGLYRVIVGKFETRMEASRLKEELMGRLPKDYSDCWLNDFAY